MEPDDVIGPTTTDPVTLAMQISGQTTDGGEPTTAWPVVANADVGNPITDLSEARSRRLARRQQRERDRLLLIVVAALVLFVVVA